MLEKNININVSNTKNVSLSLRYDFSPQCTLLAARILAENLAEIK